MQGRKKKPDVIKALEGNPGQRPLNNDAPDPDGSPVKHKCLGRYGEEVWERITISMPDRLYSSADSELLISYCVAADLHYDALLKIGKEGAVVISKGGAPYQNPWVSILNRQAQLIATLGSRLGLDPAARSSITMPKPQKKKSKFGDLIAIKPGPTE